MAAVIRDPRGKEMDERLRRFVQRHRVPAVFMPGLAYAMQGSNTMWSATALIDGERRRAVLVACNDGRGSVLNSSARLAASLLAEAE